jgi:SulP family sulfate permease
MYAISATDGFVALLTFAIAFLLKPDDAIFIGVLVALMLFIRRTVFGVYVTEMGIDAEWNVVRGLNTEYTVETIPGAAIIRVGSALYYANSTHITEMIDATLSEHAARDGNVKKLILDASGINFIDITGIEVLAQYIESLTMRDIEVAFIYMRLSVRDTIKRDPHFPAFTVINNIAEMKAWCA